MLDLMAVAGGFRDQKDLLDACQRHNGLSGKIKDKVESVIKGCKVRIVHLGHAKKVKGLGPPANHVDSEFVHEGVSHTVASYYEFMARSKPAYARSIGTNGRLLFPDVNTVNIGSRQRPILVPAHLVLIPGGQSRAKKMTPEMVSAMIKMAAVRPAERFGFLQGEGGTDDESIVQVLRSGPSSAAFGLSSIEEKPMAVNARLLPQAKLRYRDDQVIDPQLLGTWNIDRAGSVARFARAPPNPNAKGGYLYGILVVGDSIPRDLDESIK
jgi:hypothetical protein